MDFVICVLTHTSLSTFSVKISQKLTLVLNHSKLIHNSRNIHHANSLVFSTDKNQFKCVILTRHDIGLLMNVFGEKNMAKLNKLKL